MHVLRAELLPRAAFAKLLFGEDRKLGGGPTGALEMLLPDVALLRAFPSPTHRVHPRSCTSALGSDPLLSTFSPFKFSICLSSPDYQTRQQVSLGSATLARNYCLMFVE